MDGQTVAIILISVFILWVIFRFRNGGPSIVDGLSGGITNDPRPSYQQRVIQERADLWEKVDKLTKFILNPVYNTLSEDEQQILIEQHEVMLSYLEILDERIEAFR